jgi:hypothetical protein
VPLIPRLENEAAVKSRIKVKVGFGEDLVAALVVELASVRGVPEHALKLLL